MSYIYESSSYDKTAEDVEFENEILRIFTPADGYAPCSAHYEKVAGVQHKNSDGTRRSAAARKCETFNLLQFEHEPDNPFDKNAVKIIHKSSGRQLGFVEARTASDIVRRSSTGSRFVGVHRRTIIHDGYTGVVYLLIEFRPEKDLAEEKRIAEEKAKLPKKPLTARQLAKQREREERYRKISPGMQHLISKAQYMLTKHERTLYAKEIEHFNRTGEVLTTRIIEPTPLSTPAPEIEPTPSLQPQQTQPTKQPTFWQRLFGAK